MRRVIFGGLQVLFAFLLAASLYLFIKTGNVRNLSLATVFFLTVGWIGRIKNPKAAKNSAEGSGGGEYFKISAKTALLILLGGLLLPLILWLRGSRVNPFHNPEMLVTTYMVGLLISFAVAGAILLIRGPTSE